MLLLTATGEYGNFQAYVCRVIKLPLPKNKKETAAKLPIGRTEADVLWDQQRNQLVDCVGTLYKLDGHIS